MKHPEHLSTTQPEVTWLERSPNELALLSTKEVRLFNVEFLQQGSTGITVDADTLAMADSVAPLWDIAVYTNLKYCIEHLADVHDQLSVAQMKQLVDKVTYAQFADLLKVFPHLPEGVVDKRRVYEDLKESRFAELGAFEIAKLFVPDEVSAEQLLEDLLDSFTPVLPDVIGELLQEGLDPVYTYSVLMRRHLGSMVLQNIKYFQTETIHLEELLPSFKWVESGSIRSIVEDLKAKGKDINKILDVLLEAGEYRNVFPLADLLFASEDELTELYQLLIRRGRYAEIVENLDKFPSVRIDKSLLVEALVARGQFTVLVEHVDQLQPHINIQAVVGRFDEPYQYAEVIHQLHKFPPGSVDAMELFKKVCGTGYRADVRGVVKDVLASGVDANVVLDQLQEFEYVSVATTHFTAFIEAGVDVKRLVQLLWDEHSQIVLAHLDRIPEEALDVPAAMQELLQEAEYGTILYHWHRWPWQKIDRVEVMDTLLSKGSSELILKHLEKFPPAMLRQHDVIPTAILKCPWAVRNQLEAIPAEVLEGCDLSSLQIPVMSALRHHRFRQVRIWMEQRIQAKGVTTVQGFLKEAAANEVLQKMYKAGRARNAQDLATCMRYSGIVVPEESGQLEANQVVVERHSYHESNERALLDDVVGFYANTQFLHEINMMRADPTAKHRLGFGLQRELHEMHDRIKAEMAELYSWMQWYIVSAVNRELKLAPGTVLIDRHRLAPLKFDVDSMYRMAPEELILDWLEAAQVSFMGDWWDDLYGGQPWAEIAAAGYALWANGEAAHQALIDHVFDLEHNSGTAFDKRKDIVDVSEKSLKALLNLKAGAESFIEQLSDVKGASTEVIQKLQDRHATILEAKRALKAY